GTTSASGSDALNACECLAGYSGEEDGEACKACCTGEYKAKNGVGGCSACPRGTTGYSGTMHGGSCTPCDAGTFKSETGTGQCSPCQAKSEAVAGSALCQCSAGSTWPDGGACVACEAGKYKATAGVGSCVACP
ncbi:hypothetical protein T484DRAFT_1574374, partial [Baffinella frigidus]